MRPEKMVSTHATVSHMALDRPQHLARLLDARHPSEGRRAWESFTRQYSRLLLSACHRASTPGYDEMMDRYAYVLERLAADDYRRLRTFSPDGRTKFTTWLVVVVRRLCVDYHRTRYGRPRPALDGNVEVGESLVVRRRLMDLVAADIDHTRLPDVSQPDPESALARSEIGEALTRALARLSRSDRLLLAFRFEHDATSRDLGDVLGLPSRFHAYRSLKRILAIIRRSLEEEGFEDGEP